VVFHQNTLAGEWRAQVRCCEEQDIAVHRDIAFALAVADLLELPDDLPLMPAVMATLSMPTCLRDPASLAHLKTVARSAASARAYKKGVLPKSAPSQNQVETRRLRCVPSHGMSHSRKL
jgi:hypothetical protein